jgi:hypothetical protein
MSGNTVVITGKDGKYQILNNGLSEFALLGILEGIGFDLKNVRREAKQPVKEKETIQGPLPTVQQPKAPIQELNTPDVRTRIVNAIKAIKDLGGEMEDIDRNDATDEELQTELEDLTNHYKRLKNSKSVGKLESLE